MASESDAGSAAGSADEEVSWDEEHECVVVGAGGSLLAAVAAHNLGHDVVVLEKRSIYGGTMFFSAGAAWVPGNHVMDDEFKARETQQDAVSYIEGCDAGGRNDKALIEDWVSKQPSIFRYVTDSLNIPYTSHRSHDYYDYEGSNNSRTVYLKGGFADSAAEGLTDLYDGMGWTDVVSPVIDQSGLDIRLKCEVTELVTDDSGSVVGVVAKDADGNELRVRATKCVLLATGSFDRDEALTASYIMPPIATMVPMELTGDGLRMGMAIGADTSCLGADFGVALYRGKDEDESQSHVLWAVGAPLLPGAILVGKDGRRFCNESSSYDELSRSLSALNSRQSGHPDYLSGNAIAIIDSSTIETYGWPDNGDERPDWLSEYQSLDELAEDMGVDADNLSAEIEIYNKYCETGIDEDFHRGEGPYDSVEMEGQALTLFVMDSDNKNQLLAPICNPPYYAVKAVRGSLGSSGGLVVDEKCRVLRNEEPINGLYAAGCVANALCNGYPGGGFPVWSSISRSFMALDDALSLGIVTTNWE
jgi:3-oxosteroid 1-dehydrogenase